MTTDQDLGTRLEAMFAAQSSALRVPDRSWSDVPERPTPAGARRRRSSAVLAVASFAAVLAIVAVDLRAGPDEEVRTDAPAAPAKPAEPAGARRLFTVETKQVSLTAQSLLIEVSGKTFSTAPPLEVHGDPGMANEYTTLELTWSEHGVEMRLNIYFKSDGRSWWSDEIRTYDGREQGEWITYTGHFFRSPLGTAWIGDLDIRAEDHGIPGHLRLPGLRLQAFR